MMAVECSPQVAILGHQQIDFSDLEWMPEDIRRMLGDPIGYEDPRVLAWTTGNSLIARILHENPASDAMLRWVYPDRNGSPLAQPLDRILSRSPSGQALRDRLDICSVWLAEHFVCPGSSVGDLGGGSASYAFPAYAYKGGAPPGHIWEVVDLDPEALAIAEQRARDLGFEEVVRMRRVNFMRSESVTVQHDFAVLIGVLCGMDITTAVRCLEAAKRHLKPGGEILAATLLQRAFDEDPRTFRVLCNVGGWQLRPKQLEQVLDIFRIAGWDVQSVFSERAPYTPGSGQYAIVHARAL